MIKKVVNKGSKLRSNLKNLIIIHKLLFTFIYFSSKTFIFIHLFTVLKQYSLIFVLLSICHILIIQSDNDDVNDNDNSTKTTTTIMVAAAAAVATTAVVNWFCCYIAIKGGEKRELLVLTHSNMQ